MWGIFPSSRDLVKIILSGSSIEFLHSFISLGCILSGPYDFEALILSIAFDIL